MIWGFLGFLGLLGLLGFLGFLGMGTWFHWKLIGCRYVVP